jgi:hypothetical protein
MTRRSCFAAALLAASLTLATSPASALSIKEFRKYSREEQAVYIAGAVSMVAFNYATTGESAKAQCVQNWYFAHKGIETPGPHQIAVELGVAEDMDAEKYHVEGIILGLTDKVCGTSAKAK